MDVREKLVELLREVQYLGGLEEKIADNLIANGITVHEWVSVNDRLPQATEYVLIYDSHYRNIYKAWYVGDIDVWFSNEYLPQFINITHWMPLPKPPKES